MYKTSSVLGSKLAQGHFAIFYLSKKGTEQPRFKGRENKILHFNGKSYKVQGRVRNCDHFCKPSIIGREKLESKRKQKEVRG